MEEITLTLKKEEVKKIMNALSTKPWIEVNDLMAKIHLQSQPKEKK